MNIKKFIEKYKGKLIAGLGLVIVGGGVSIISRAGFIFNDWKKQVDPLLISWREWFFIGTMGIAIFCAGIALVVSGTLEYNNKKI